MEMSDVFPPSSMLCYLVWFTVGSRHGSKSSLYSHAALTDWSQPFFSSFLSFWASRRLMRWDDKMLSCSPLAPSRVSQDSESCQEATPLTRMQSRLLAKQIYNLLVLLIIGYSTTATAFKKLDKKKSNKGSSVGVFVDDLDSELACWQLLLITLCPPCERGTRGALLLPH